MQDYQTVDVTRTQQTESLYRAIYARIERMVRKRRAEFEVAQADPELAERRLAQAVASQDAANDAAREVPESAVPVADAPNRGDNGHLDDLPSFDADDYAMPVSDDADEPQADGSFAPFESGSRPLPPVAPELVVSAFLTDEGTWAKRTARLYRAAIAFVLAESGLPDGEHLRSLLFRENVHGDALLDDRQKLRDLRRPLRWRPRTSAQKAKRFHHDEARALQAAVLNSRSQYAEATAAWFAASILTGLRPTEWQNTALENDPDGDLILVVRNAKHTNGRAHGISRTLGLREMSREQLAIIQRHLLFTRNVQSIGRFDHQYNECRRLLGRTANRLWPDRLRHPTLYTGRHMFTADAKSTFDQLEVAALLGHASAETAGLHYAQRRFGRGSVAVRPATQDVAAVAHRNPEIAARPKSPARSTPASAAPGAPPPSPQPDTGGA